MNQPSGSGAKAIVRRAAGLGCVGAWTIAALALVGWMVGQPALTNFIPGKPTMNPLSASCILLLSTSLWILGRRDPGALVKWSAQGCGALVAAIGTLRLFSICSGIDLHVDQVLLRDQVLASTFPSRMGLSAAVCSICAGLGLMTLDLRIGRAWHPAEPFALAGLAVALTALIGYAYGAPPLHGMMAINTACAFLLLTTAMLLARPDRGICVLVLSASPGGILARRVLPVGIVLPIILGWVRLKGQQAGFYGLEIGTAFLVLTIVGALVWLVGMTGRRLDVADHERRVAEDALRRSLERQNLLLDANLIGVLTANSEGVIIEANPAFLNLIGYAREELPLKSFAITPPEWHERTVSVLRDIAERGKATPFEKEYIHKDGSRVPVLVGAAAIPGAASEILAFVIDLSDKRRAEIEIERMRVFLDSIIENLPNMVFVKDAEELRFVRLNRAGEDLLGVSREKLIGKNDYDLFPKEQADFFVAKDRSVLEGHQLLDIPEEPIQTMRGETRILHTKKVPILDPDGGSRYLLGISEDITAHKQAERELAALNEGLQRRTEELEVANKELESFSYSVSHDLRAPLRHIDGFADLLTRQAGPALDDTGRRYLETISSSAKGMGQLIDDLLSFSRMARTEMQHSIVDVGRLVAGVQAAIEPETVGRDITWTIGSLPTLRCDAGMLRLAFTNLLSNAVKYSGGRQQARIDVGSSEANGEVIIFVRDNGVGFDMEYSHKLFRVFQRLHSDEDFAGTGVGLANVRRVITRHGGRTWAEGEIDAGATFYVAFPRALKTEEEGAMR